MTEKELERELEERKSYVSFPMFSGVMVIIIALMGWFLIVNNSLAARIDIMSGEYTKIQTQLSQIQTDLVWLKQNLK